MINILRFTRNISNLNPFYCVPKCNSVNYAPKTMGVPLVDLVNKLKTIAPLDLAESWDNVGLLVEPNRFSDINTVLLAIDLTEDVVDEAIDTGSKLIISYHPNIFRPLKTISQGTWKERIIIKCIQNNIAIFSPHTSWDAMEGGVNDWLGEAFKSKSSKPILPNSNNPSIGMGRILTLEKPITLSEAIDHVKKHIGIPHLRVGVAKHKELGSLISSVALCAGSGTSVLSGVEADLYLTGEMLHHDVLEATQKGTHVILCNHSDSERGFLKKFQEKIQNDQLNVLVSKIDKDCLTTL